MLWHDWSFSFHLIFSGQKLRQSHLTFQSLWPLWHIYRSLSPGYNYAMILSSVSDTNISSGWSCVPIYTRVFDRWTFLWHTRVTSGTSTERLCGSGSFCLFDIYVILLFPRCNLMKTVYGGGCGITTALQRWYAVCIHCSEPSLNAPLHKNVPFDVSRSLTNRSIP